MKSRSLSGFSLMELSIVLVIIGLIIGGIVLGKSLLTGSQLQTVITDADNYITVTGNFKQAYQALPGDMLTATTLWGTDSSGCPSGGGTSGTCNGNANGKIADNVSGEEYESFRFWQHLYYAGMFSKRLSGAASSGGGFDSSVGVNVPSSSVPGGGFSVITRGTLGSGDTNFIAGTYINMLVFGSRVANNGTNGPVLTADQAMAIDGKIDDGFAGTGTVRGPKSTSTLSPSCTTSATPAAWNVAQTGVNCSVLFELGN